MTPAFTHDAAGTPAEAWSRPERDALSLLEIDRYRHLVVVAAHPDDESLGAGGLVATAAARGQRITLVLATAGEGSHPRSPTHTPGMLAAVRRAEADAALAQLAPGARLVFLGQQDGSVADGEDALVAALVDEIGLAGADTLVVAPWRGDGHPDHEAAGRAAAAAARRTDARLVEYPIWWWHWGTPEEAPWHLLRRLPLAPEARRRRDRAVAAHRSQVRPLSVAPGDEALLSERVLAHFRGGSEHFVVDSVTDDRLDRLHRAEPDPWGTDRRWYEERKRRLVLASLPRRRYARILDLGCSTGALTADLATRLTPDGHLLALDASQAAVDAARERLASADEHRVGIRRGEIPRDLPDGPFDLVALSEVGYFLSPRDLDGLRERVADLVDPEGTVLLCHWRHPIVGWPLDGPQVHRAFEDAFPLPVQARYRDRDVELLILSADESWPAP
ncbi:bifunctional PIG-L family deacetylase/class I SAM-dependent methyltransferase [Nocardioides sp. GY 10113]|uniref:bifunctional PIG-L family deacetylase/class I SAM-dependent methyltransferase n=1 Tax=Nocardioides sp. GY 10113 TaxID=2569761 RepID=UPI001458A882|nr:bifunctional PIG-L family deacetylase/class I SAM-dependent methyltransferase [Nocardioides sp. GY 10113]